MLQRGWDGGKKINGRKRFVVVDSLGYWIEVVVVPASVPERAGAEALFREMEAGEMSASLGTILADGGFEGEEWQEKIYQQFGLEVEVVKRSDEAEGFELLPQRWIVERSFGWMNYYRRLSKDYEGHVKLSRSWMLWAMIDKILHTLEPDW